MAAMPMIQAPLPQTAGLPVPTSEAALAQLARAALGLVQSAGQPVPGLVLGTMAGGLTQLQIGEMVLAVRLSAPLAAGTAVRLSTAPDSKGQPALQVTPVAAGSTTPSGTPAPAGPAASVPQMAAIAGETVPERMTQGPMAPAQASPRPPAGQPAAATGGTVPRPTMGGATPIAAAPHAAAATPLDIQELAQGGVRAPAASPPNLTGPGRPTPVVTPPASPGATGVAPTATPASAAVPTMPGATVSPVPAAADGDALPAPASPATPSAPTTTSGGSNSPTLPASAQAIPPGAGAPGAAAMAAQPQMPLPVGGPQPAVAGATGAPTMLTAAAGMAASASTAPSPSPSPSPAPVQTSQVPVAVTSGSAVPVAAPAAGSAVAIPYRAVPTGPLPAPAPALPLVQVLADPTQAAARQNSIVPLLARLAALGPRLDGLPLPAAQAALQLLAMRLTAGNLDGKALQRGVATAGVLARPGGGASPASPTQKSALLQLRGGVAGMPGAAIEPVTAVAGRPHPPMRGDEARAVRAELPLPLPLAGEEPARGLLNQADAALSRLKLLQHASQAPETRPGAPAAQQELRVELPFLIGVETALLQLVVDHEARRREKPGERGWRMRFAFASQQTGEVGAEVALFGPSVSVGLWAETPEMEAALTEGLDSLRAALTAEGLEAGSVRVRRRMAAPTRQPGALMDSAR